jgi:hypothetical protein
VAEANWTLVLPHQGITWQAQAWQAHIHQPLNCSLTLTCLLLQTSTHTHPLSNHLHFSTPCFLLFSSTSPLLPPLPEHINKSLLM